MIIGNKTSCRPIWPLIILVINKSDSCCAVVLFCYHSYDYRPNWTPLSPITITNNQTEHRTNSARDTNVINNPTGYRTNSARDTNVTKNQTVRETLTKQINKQA